MSVIIKEVKENDKSAKKAFVKFPIDLYKDSPYYVPPLILDELDGFQILRVKQRTGDVSIVRTFHFTSPITK